MKSGNRKVVILGATRGMGRAVARRLAERGDHVFVLSQSQIDGERSASDLSVRGEGNAVGWHHCDLEAPATFAPALDAADKWLGDFDTVVVTAARFATQEELEKRPSAARSAFDRRFHQHDPVLRGSPQALAGPGGRHLVRVQLRGG